GAARSSPAVATPSGARGTARETTTNPHLATPPYPNGAQGRGELRDKPRRSRTYATPSQPHLTAPNTSASPCSQKPARQWRDPRTTPPESAARPPSQAPPPRRRTSRTPQTPSAPRKPPSA